MREHEPRHAVGERRLADAGRTADQKCMGHAAAAIGREQACFRLGMAKQKLGRARMARLVVVLVAAHEATSSNIKGAVAGSRRRLTVFQIRLLTLCFSPLASMTTQRSGSCAATKR